MARIDTILGENGSYPWNSLRVYRKPVIPADPRLEARRVDPFDGTAAPFEKLDEGSGFGTAAVQDVYAVVNISRQSAQCDTGNTERIPLPAIQVNGGQVVNAGELGVSQLTLTSRNRGTGATRSVFIGDLGAGGVVQIEAPQPGESLTTAWEFAGVPFQVKRNY